KTPMLLPRLSMTPSVKSVSYQLYHHHRRILCREPQIIHRHPHPHRVRLVVIDGNRADLDLALPRHADIVRRFGIAGAHLDVAAGKCLFHRGYAQVAIELDPEGSAVTVEYRRLNEPEGR